MLDRPNHLAGSANKEQARAFLNALDPDVERFTFQSFEDSKRNNNKRGSARVLHGTLDELWNGLCQLSSGGAGVFVTINETNFHGRAADNVVRVRAYFVDLDGAPFQNVQRLGLALHPQIVVETSEGRYHLYWIVHGANLSKFRLTQLRLARLLGGDEQVSDLSRVMRLPGFPHQKNPAAPFLPECEIYSIFPYSDADFQARLAEAESQLGLADQSSDIDVTATVSAALQKSGQKSTRGLAVQRIGSRTCARRAFLSVRKGQKDLVRNGRSGSFARLGRTRIRDLGRLVALCSREL
jgi:hypothetical protein